MFQLFAHALGVGQARAPAAEAVSGHPDRGPIAYLNEEHKRDPHKSLSSLLDEAGMRFNLTPVDAEALEFLFRKEQKRD